MAFVGACGFQDIHGAGCIYGMGFERVIEGLGNIADSGEMENGVAIFGSFFEGVEIENGSPDDVGLDAIEVEVGFEPVAHIIDYSYFGALIEEGKDEMGADESGTAGYESFFRVVHADWTF